MRSLDVPLHEAFAAEYRWERERMHSRDAVEGPEAFSEGRDPVRLGR